MPVERIETQDDPRVADYRNVRDADLLKGNALFMAEGELVVRTLVDRSPLSPRSLLLSDTRLEAMSDLVERLPEQVPAYVATQDVMDEIVGFPIHRGCLAAGERPPARDPHTLMRQAAEGGRAALILEDLANHDNIGGLFRSGAAFGVGCVLLTRRCCDPLYRKAIRVSIGAALTIPFAFIESASEGVEIARAAGLLPVGFSPEPGAESLADLVRTGGPATPPALLIGAEGPGLSEEAKRAAGRLVRIEIDPDVDSLNAMVAGSIALFALTSIGGWLDPGRT